MEGSLPMRGPPPAQKQRQQHHHPVTTSPVAVKVKMEKVEAEEYDPDPIRASYDVFIKPQMDGERQIFVLQFPNRDANQPYSAANDCQPQELRIKPAAGMVELDVPLDVYRNYDKEKGIKWGDAMKKSATAKGGGSHGMPGGFSIGGAQPGARGRGRGDADEVENHVKLLDDYNGAVQRDQVLKKQTLGGQVLPQTETSPQYMIGVFRDGQLHLTPVDHIVQMRPQFHHIDAAAEQERLARARDLGTPRVQEARAIHMTVKSTIDGEDDSADTMAQRIAAVQAEPWRRHRYIDEESPEAWAAFEESMFVGAEIGRGTEELLAGVPRLVSGVTDLQYLDMINTPRDAAKLSRAKGERKGRGRKKGKGKDAAADGESEGESTLSESASGSESEEEDAAS